MHSNTHNCMYLYAKVKDLMTHIHESEYVDEFDSALQVLHKLERSKDRRVMVIERMNVHNGDDLDDSLLLLGIITWKDVFRALQDINWEATWGGFYTRQACGPCVHAYTFIYVCRKRDRSVFPAFVSTYASYMNIHVHTFSPQDLLARQLLEISRRGGAAEPPGSPTSRQRQAFLFEERRRQVFIILTGQYIYV